MSMDKRTVRDQTLALRKGLSEQDRAFKSNQIQRQALELEELAQAKTVMLFLNFRDEVETTILVENVLALGKRVILPRCAPQCRLIPAQISDLKTDLESGAWGIREPRLDQLVEVDPEDIDLVFMPGAAFDTEGNRIGYGGGFYDRFLEHLRPGVPKIAIAFACQVLPKVPVEPFDKKVDMILTENGLFRIPLLR